jgi:hypothetical protein
MGVDVPDDFAGKMKGGTTKKDRNSQQMTTIGSPLFVIYFYPGSSPPILTGDEGKRKEKREPQIKLAGYTPTDLFGKTVVVSLSRGVITAPTLFFPVRSFVPPPLAGAESESDGSSTTHIQTHTPTFNIKGTQEWLQLFGT